MNLHYSLMAIVLLITSVPAIPTPNDDLQYYGRPVTSLSARGALPLPLLDGHYVYGLSRREPLIDLQSLQEIATGRDGAFIPGTSPGENNLSPRTTPHDVDYLSNVHPGPPVPPSPTAPVPQSPLPTSTPASSTNASYEVYGTSSSGSSSASNSLSKASDQKKGSTKKPSSGKEKFASHSKARTKQAVKVTHP